MPRASKAEVLRGSGFRMLGFRGFGFYGAGVRI